MGPPKGPSMFARGLTLGEAARRINAVMAQFENRPFARDPRVSESAADPNVVTPRLMWAAFEQGLRDLGVAGASEDVLNAIRGEGRAKIQAAIDDAERRTGSRRSG